MSRTRNWALVIYPDSAPENWLEIIDELHTEALLSPLHDRDVDADGEPKKPHYHLLLLFNGVKSYEQVNRIAEVLGTQHPVTVQSARGYARYLTHMDNPEKAQYDKDDVKGFAGVDINEYLRLTSSERYSIIADMMEHVRKYNVTEFAELVEFAAKYHRDDWFPLLCDNSAYVMTMYIKSKRFQALAGIATPAVTIEEEQEREEEFSEFLNTLGKSISEQDSDDV